MPTFPAVRLDTDRLPNGPWIFGRQVLPPHERLEPGQLVEVLDHSQRFIGHALYNPASDIRLRVLNRGRKSELTRPRDFLLRRLAAADRLRRKTLRLGETTNSWRIAHAEGDDLPGLIVDKLGDALVCEYHALGFWRLREDIEWALGELHPGTRVVHRVPKAARNHEDFLGAGEGRALDALEEEAPVEVDVIEHGLRFPVAAGRGHKTGWFCDQRDNRHRVASYAEGRDVLDICCNAGGFALAAARAGARRVRGVDLDEVALERAARASEVNQLPVEWIHADAYDHLRATRREKRRPDLVVLDPHKIIAGRAQIEAGKRRYSDLNTLGMECVAPGGLLATFSCSGALDLPSFLGLLFQAGRRAERDLRLLGILEAGPDHPQRPEFPRSRYLKGALLALD